MYNKYFTYFGGHRTAHFNPSHFNRSHVTTAGGSGGRTATATAASVGDGDAGVVGVSDGRGCFGHIDGFTSTGRGGLGGRQDGGGRGVGLVVVLVVVLVILLSIVTSPTNTRP